MAANAIPRGRRRCRRVQLRDAEREGDLQKVGCGVEWQYGLGGVHHTLNPKPYTLNPKL